MGFEQLLANPAMPWFACLALAYFGLTYGQPLYALAGIAGAAFLLEAKTGLLGAALRRGN